MTKIVLLAVDSDEDVISFAKKGQPVIVDQAVIDCREEPSTSAKLVVGNDVIYSDGDAFRPYEETSYPYLKLACEFGVPYGDVLKMAACFEDIYGPNRGKERSISLAAHLVTCLSERYGFAVTQGAFDIWHREDKRRRGII